MLGILLEVRKLLARWRLAPESQYRSGGIAFGEETEAIIQDAMWAEGEDEPE